MIKKEVADQYQESLRHDEPIGLGVLVSIGLHLLLVAGFTIKAVFFTAPEIDFSQAVRVDLVGLPDKLDPNTALAPQNPEQKESAKPADKKDPSPVPPAPAPKVELPDKQQKPIVENKKAKETKSAEPEAIKIEKNKAKQSSAIAKLKAMDALEKIKADVQSEKKPMAGNGTGRTGAPLIKGNIISAGSSLTGLSKLQHDEYIANLDRHIKEHWTLPEWLAAKDYKAQVRVYIDSRGMLVGKALVKSSGNPTYDDYALATIEKSIPFPIPPEKLTAHLEINGFVVGFPE